MRDPSGVEDLLLQVTTASLASHSVDRRIDAMRLERRRAEELQSILLNHLRLERNEIVLTEVLETLSTTRLDPEAVSSLLALAENHKSVLVRAYSIAALASTPNPRVWEFLRSRLSLESRDRVRLELFLALLRIGERDRLQEVITLMLESDDYRTQCAAVNGLAELDLGDQRSLFAVALTELLGSRPPRAVESAISAAKKRLEADN